MRDYYAKLFSSLFTEHSKFSKALLFLSLHNACFEALIIINVQNWRVQLSYQKKIGEYNLNCYSEPYKINKPILSLGEFCRQNDYRFAVLGIDVEPSNSVRLEYSKKRAKEIVTLIFKAFNTSSKGWGLSSILTEICSTLTRQWIEKDHPISSSNNVSDCQFNP